MKVDLIKNIIEIRTAVSYLAEKNKWWETHFHEPSSKDFLGYIFPKSRNTQFSCSIVVTRNFIDSQVGAKYYHLFRLPISFEELLHKNEIASIVEPMESEEAAITLLAHTADSLSVNSDGGPKNIGSVDELDHDLMQVFAAEYLSAFRNNYIVHPYLN